ncbi:MAG TPA: acetyl-CoA C-acyltransferase, partial [Verrucomicrobiae bacterium]|nr:acetyl-CoA C-acyltransferase [Verrucomicrobiae bacterium]
MREAVIVSSVRTAVGKSGKGALRTTRPDDLAAVAIKGALERVPQINPKEIEDVIIGCATPEAEQGMNVARIASLRAGLPVEVSAMTINRFCS